MSWTPADLPDLTGATALVTGATSGLGLETVKALVGAGATVVLAVRRPDAGRAAAAELGGSTRVERLDLADLGSVRALAERWEGPLDLLVNNAGVMRPPIWTPTADGLELQYGTNHIGHVALTARLLPALLAAGSPRVVTVSSLAHHAGDESLLEGNPAASYAPNQAYGSSKLGNLLFARELQRRATAAGSPLVSTACHPGISATGLFSHPDGMGAHRLMRWIAPVIAPVVLQSAAAGAIPTLYAATVAEPGSYSGPRHLGEIRGGVGPARLSEAAQDLTLQEAAWDRALADAGVELAFA